MLGAIIVTAIVGLVLLGLTKLGDHVAAKQREEKRRQSELPRNWRTLPPDHFKTRPVRRIYRGRPYDWKVDE